MDTNKENSPLIDAIVLAGGKCPSLLRECTGEDNEALIKISQKPMVNYVAEALNNSKHIGHIVIVGPEEIKELLPEGNITVVSPEETPLENLIKGLNFVDNSQMVLVATCDIPLLTSEGVDDFILNSIGEGVDFFYPIVPMDRIYRLFPDIKRTSVNLEEGIFTGGNLFLINPMAIGGCMTKVEKFVALRKSPIKLCRILGLRFVFKFILKRLSIPELEGKVSELLGIKGRAVITLYPEVGVDIDKPSDYSIVLAYLNRPA